MINVNDKRIRPTSLEKLYGFGRGQKLQGKRIEVAPGKRLSLSKAAVTESEHWVGGNAKITLNDGEIIVKTYEAVER
jgi:hypothetical protein